MMRAVPFANQEKSGARKAGGILVQYSNIPEDYWQKPLVCNENPKHASLHKTLFLSGKSSFFLIGNIMYYYWDHHQKK